MSRLSPPDIKKEMRLETGNIYGFYIPPGTNRKEFKRVLEKLCEDITLPPYDYDVIAYSLIDEGLFACDGIIVMYGYSILDGSPYTQVLYVDKGTYHNGHLETQWPDIIHVDLKIDNIKPIEELTKPFELC